MTSNSNDIIRLNVGGQHFITTRTTLLCKSKDLYLRKCFVLILILHNRSRSVEKSFWDRKSDSIWFAFLIYLRDAGHVMVDLQSNDENNDDEALFRRLRTDADFFGLQGLVSYCDTKLSVMMYDKELEETYYDYCQNSDCVSPGPGWRLYKYIPSIYNSTGDRRVEGGKFIFEMTTHTSNPNDSIGYHHRATAARNNEMTH